MVTSKAQDFKIGLFMIVGVALLMLGLLRMDLLDMGNSQRVKVLFHFTGGLEVGAPVHLAGVPVGEVEDIQILRDEDRKTRVEVTAKMRNDILVEEDARVRIGTLGLLGTKYLEILPGIAETALREGVYLEGEDAVMLDQVVASGEKIASKMEMTVDSLNALMGDEAFVEDFKGNVENFSTLINELRLMTASMNEILDGMKQGRGLMGKLISDESVYEDLTELVADVKAHPWKLLKKK